MAKQPRKKANREGHTPAILLWTDALSFIDAAHQLTRFDVPPLDSEKMRHRTPRLYLATHGIELAMKSHLRANGSTLRQLTGLGHSLTKTLAACLSTDMEAPSEQRHRALEFLSVAHERHEFRYGHTDHPPHMDHRNWINVALWALRAAIPAVAADTVSATEYGTFKKAMTVQISRLLRAPDMRWNSKEFVRSQR
jgi:hypothetical protein